MIWQLPVEDLLPSARAAINDYTQLQRIGVELTEKMDSLGARCEVERMIVGPQVTRYEMVPQEGLSVRNMPKMAPDLAFEIAAESVTIIAPIPGKRAVGIEIPTPSRQTVNLRDVLDLMPR